LILIGLLLLARLIGMVEVPLMDTTEARYGEIGRKMAELNDWITPWFDYGVPYWGKPPLAFWFTAISFKLFGVNEFTARLPHLLVSLVIIALMGWLAGRRDGDARLPTVALASGCAAYFISAGAVMVDMELTLGTSLAMAGFWLSLEPPVEPCSSQRTAGRSGWRAGSLFFGGLILGLLAKGPVALVLAGAPLLLWTVYNRRWFDVWHRLPWFRGLSLTLLIAVPWYWIAERRTPGFLEYFLVGEHWHKFLVPGWSGDLYGHAHSYPIGTIWAFAVVDTLPWSILLPIAAWRWRKSTTLAAIAAGIASVLPANWSTGGADRSDAETLDDRAWQNYLLMWAFAPLLFFTAARNIMLAYVLPGLPAAAILVGSWLARQGRQGRQIERLLSLGLLITLLLMCRLTFEGSLPATIEYKSVKPLVTAYDQARTPGASSPAAASSTAEPAQSDAPLIFIGGRPFSAEFYSRGRAIQVHTFDQCWQHIGTHAAYVAVPVQEGDAFIASEAQHSESITSLREADKSVRFVGRVGHYGDFDLFFVAAQ